MQSPLLSPPSEDSIPLPHQPQLAQQLLQYQSQQPAINAFPTPAMSRFPVPPLQLNFLNNTTTQATHTAYPFHYPLTPDSARWSPSSYPSALPSPLSTPSTPFSPLTNNNSPYNLSPHTNYGGPSFSGSAGTWLLALNLVLLFVSSFFRLNCHLVSDHELPFTTSKCPSKSTLTRLPTSSQFLPAFYRIIHSCTTLIFRF